MPGQYAHHMRQPLSEERKTAFYVGTALMVIGGLSFASVFITAAMHFGDSVKNVESNCEPSPQGAATGRRPFRSGRNRTSAAAASHRSS